MKKAQLRDRLQEAMQLRGLRAVDIVDRTGIPKNTLSYYLSGKSEPKADRIHELAVVLDVNEAWLLGYEVSMSRSHEQKKNDQLAELVVRLRKDDDFYKAVAELAELDETHLKTAIKLLGALQK